MYVLISPSNVIYASCIALLAITLNAVWDAKSAHQLYDPFDILGVSTGATENDITKAFKKLSRKYHPDKAEDKEEAEIKFVEISKAYKTLTDPVARKNWEEHGNPDGPRNFSLGIALPSWLVDKKYSFLVLAFYLLVFGLGVPYMVSKSWMQSKRYTKDKILHSTMEVYFHQLKDGMSFKKLFDLLASSLEFKEEFVLTLEYPKLIDGLIEDINKFIAENGGEKYEKPKSLSEEWMIKAHVLLYAYFNRVPVTNVHLKADQEKMIVKACHLALGMLQIALARQWLQTASQCIALVQCLVQAVYEGQSSLLQLPYVDGQMVKYAKNRKTPIKTIRQLVELPEDDRKNLLRSLSDEQYSMLMTVAKSFPEVVLDSAKFVTLGQPHVIPGGIITCKLKLRLVRSGAQLKPAASVDLDEAEVENFEFDEDGNLIDSAPIRSIGKNEAEDLNTPVFCPHFPNDKRPYWWVVITNTPNTAIVTTPVKVTDLVDTKMVTIQFPAPNRPGQIALNVHIKSDCLVGVDFFKSFTFNVLPMKEQPKERWDISGDESDSDGSAFGGGCSDAGCDHAH